MSSTPWHKRYHSDALTGYLVLTLEERGAYTTFLDMMYDRGEPLVSNDRLLAGYLGVSLRKYKSLVAALIEKGKIYRTDSGDLSNSRFDKEREKDAKTSRKRAENGLKGGRKSGKSRRKAKENNETGEANTEAKTKHIPEARSQSNSSSNEEHAQSAILTWNEFAARCGWSQVQKLTKPRISAINARLNDCGGLDGWRVAVRRASSSHFLTGQTDRPFFASFDWLTKPSNFTKLMEGNYDNRTGPNPSRPTGGRSNPHDGIMAGFAKFANSEPDAGGPDQGQHSQPDYPGDTSMDRGSGGYTSEPILRVINPV